MKIESAKEAQGCTTFSVGFGWYYKNLVSRRHLESYSDKIVGMQLIISSNVCLYFIMLITANEKAVVVPQRLTVLP
jgi:hypothetical protein